MENTRKRRRLVMASVLMGTALLLSGCSGSKDKDKTLPPQESAEALYGKGREAFSSKQYSDAVEMFDEVERQHPYSQWAPRAQIMTAYAHYKAQNYDESLVSLDRFIRLHPGHESAAYAYYMTALCYYEQISDVGRDQGITEKAQQALRDVVSRFPDSDYARDAKLKMDLARDHLAGKEMMVGRYYLERDEYLAGINRFKRVIDEYQTTSHVPEALHRLVESYLKLGIVDEAKRYAAVLGHNFPEGEWYRYSYKLLKGEVGSPVVPAENSTASE